MDERDLLIGWTAVIGGTIVGLLLLGGLWYGGYRYGVHKSYHKGYIDGQADEREGLYRALSLQVEAIYQEGHDAGIKECLAEDTGGHR